MRFDRARPPTCSCALRSLLRGLAAGTKRTYERQESLQIRLRVVISTLRLHTRNHCRLCIASSLVFVGLFYLNVETKLGDRIRKLPSQGGPGRWAAAPAPPAGGCLGSARERAAAGPNGRPCVRTRWDERGESGSVWYRSRRWGRGEAVVESVQTTVPTAAAQIGRAAQQQPFEAAGHRLDLQSPHPSKPSRAPARCAALRFLSVFVCASMSRFRVAPGSTMRMQRYPLDCC